MKIKTFLSTIFLGLTFIFIQSCSKPTFEFNAENQMLRIIPWDNGEADSKNNPKMKRMIEEYLDHPKRLKTKVEDNTETLEYLRIPVADIKSLLDGNLNDTDEVLIMFAVSSDTYTENWRNQKFTVVMASAKTIKKKLMVQTNPVFNVFSPCPDKCLEYSDNISNRYDNPPIGAIKCPSQAKLCK